MNKIKFALSVLFLLLSFSIYSQEANFKTTLAFACYGSGSSSKPVNEMYHYLAESNYSKIIPLLSSKNSAEKFLAVVICEKLAEKGKIKLDAKDLAKISNAYNSDELVYVCSGCSFEGNFKMSILLNKKEDPEAMRDEADIYFKKFL